MTESPTMSLMPAGVGVSKCEQEIGEPSRCDGGLWDNVWAALSPVGLVLHVKGSGVGVRVGRAFSFRFSSGAGSMSQIAWV